MKRCGKNETSFPIFPMKIECICKIPENHFHVLVVFVFVQKAEGIDFVYFLCFNNGMKEYF